MASATPLVYAGADATIIEGQQFSGHGSFSDLDSSKWTATVDFGDGTGVHTLKLNPPTTGTPNEDGYTNGTNDTFDLSHVYTTARTDPYTVTVRVTDDSGLVGTDVLNVKVVNAPPTIDNSAFTVTPTVINEGGTVYVSGTFADASPIDSHTVTIIWGDGPPTLAHVDEATQTFTASHVYADNPVGTSSGVYALQASVSDTSGATASTTYGLFFVQVNNVLPSSVTITPSVTTANEGDPVSVSGSFFDPGVQDSHVVKINWGDGTSSNAAINEHSQTYVASHIYANNPADPTKPYTITAGVTDNDEPLATPATATTTIAVNNVAPANVHVRITSGNTTIHENDTVTVEGDFTDPGAGDAHTVVISWGDGSSDKVLTLAAGLTNFANVSHKYLNNPLHVPTGGTFDITAAVTDFDQAAATSPQTPITVNDTAPQILSSSLSLTRPGSSVPITGITEGDSVTVTGTYSDVGTKDREKVAVNWGDGADLTISGPAVPDITSASVNSVTHTFTATHKYRTEPGGTHSYTIAAVATDNDGLSNDGTGTNPPPATIAVTVAAAQQVQVLPGTGNSASTMSLTSNVIDPGTKDRFTYVWTITEANDNSVSTGPTNAADFTFQYQSGDTYTVNLSVTDQEGTTTGADPIVMQIVNQTDATVHYTSNAADPTSFFHVNAHATQLVVIATNRGDGGQTIDASHVDSIPVVLDDGGSASLGTGRNLMFGGTQNDTLILHPGGGRADYADGGKGDDHYLLNAQCDLILVDAFGQNTVDFAPTNYGVTFDLSNSEARRKTWTVPLREPIWSRSTICTARWQPRPTPTTRTRSSRERRARGEPLARWWVRRSPTP